MNIPLLRVSLIQITFSDILNQFCAFVVAQVFCPFDEYLCFGFLLSFPPKGRKKKITFLLDKILLHLRIASLENSAVREWPRSNWRTFSVLDKTLSEY